MTQLRLTTLLAMSLLAACYGGEPVQVENPPAPTGKTKGQLINECMSTGTPEACDRKINSRRTSY